MQTTKLAEDKKWHSHLNIDIRNDEKTYANSVMHISSY